MFNTSKVQLLNPLNNKTCPLLRPLNNKTCPLLRPLNNKTCQLLRPLNNMTCQLLKTPIFSPIQHIFFMSLDFAIKTNSLSGHISFSLK